jgi:predicted regulator of Ras-like GTPase activity (Roadblock/LC7/MglB family)
MDPARALADLKEISSQIESAALFDADGSVIASTFADDEAAHRFVETARALLAAAEEVQHAPDAALAQLEVATLDGSVFVVRDAERVVAATTRPEPTVGLVFYDLKSCLRSAAAPGGENGKPRPQPPPTAEQPPPAAEPGQTQPGEGETAA